MKRYNNYYLRLFAAICALSLPRYISTGKSNSYHGDTTYNNSRRTPFEIGVSSVGSSGRDHTATEGSQGRTVETESTEYTRTGSASLRSHSRGAQRYSGSNGTREDYSASGTASLPGAANRQEYSSETGSTSMHSGSRSRRSDHSKHSHRSKNRDVVTYATESGQSVRPSRRRSGHHIKLENSTLIGDYTKGLVPNKDYSDIEPSQVINHEGKLVPLPKDLPAGSLERQHYMYSIGETDLPVGLNDTATKWTGPYHIDVDKERDAMRYYVASRKHYLSFLHGDNSLKNRVGTAYAEVICKALPYKKLDSKFFNGLRPYKSPHFDLLKEIEPKVDAPRVLNAILPGTKKYKSEEVIWCIFVDEEDNPQTVYVSGGSCEHSVFLYRKSEITIPGKQPILQVMKHILLDPSQQEMIKTWHNRLKGKMELQKDPARLLSDRF